MEPNWPRGCRIAIIREASGPSEWGGAGGDAATLAGESGLGLLTPGGPAAAMVWAPAQSHARRASWLGGRRLSPQLARGSWGGCGQARQLCALQGRLRARRPRLWPQGGGRGPPRSDERKGRGGSWKLSDERGAGEHALGSHHRVLVKPLLCALGTARCKSSRDLLHLARLFVLKQSGRESSQVWKGCCRRFRLTEHACPGRMPQTPRPFVDATSCPARGASLGASVPPVIPGCSLEHVCGAG